MQPFLSMWQQLLPMSASRHSCCPPFFFPALTVLLRTVGEERSNRAGTSPPPLPPEEDEAVTGNSQESTTLNEILLEAVKGGLAYFGSSEVSDSLLFILELEHSFNVSDVAECIPALRAGLERMFGGAGHVVERKVKVELASLISTSYEGKSLDQLVVEARAYVHGIQERARANAAEQQ